jgi:hypothetical protein
MSKEQTPARQVSNALSLVDELAEFSTPDQALHVALRLITFHHRHAFLMVNNLKNEDDIDVHKHGPFPWVQGAVCQFYEGLGEDGKNRTFE